MTLQVEFGYVVSLFVAVVGAFWGMAKLLLAQSTKHIDEKFKGISDTLRSQDESSRRVERELMDHKTYVAREYVRREDHTRVFGSVQVSIENLRLSIERLLEKRGPLQ